MAVQHMNFWSNRIVRSLLTLVIACVEPAVSRAAVAVISNRTEADVSFSVTPPGAEGTEAKVTSYRLASGDLTVVPLQRGGSAQLVTTAVGGGSAVRGGAGGGTSYEIRPDAAYYFGTLASNKVALGRIGVGGMPAADPVIERPPKANGPEADEAARTITVKILVDEEEQAKTAIWHRRLQQRVEAASEIIERHCGMKLKVVGFDTWQSDNSITQFEDAVAEFVRKADPGEARLAIGFTSQYQIVKGRTHLGGTRGPLARHILLREWSQYVSEPERLELLVHEVGHFLGAVHSPESDSVMRVILGDRQARARKFQIHFDPLNTLAMNIVAEQWREHPLRNPFDLSGPTKDRLRAIYQAIDQALPDDPAAAQYLHILQRTSLPQITVGSQ